jgi:hypothetical protein
MSDHYSKLTVVLEYDLRDDDAEALISCIKMMRGVLEVSGDVTNASDYMATVRAKRELGQKLLEVLYPGVYTKKQ